MNDLHRKILIGDVMEQIKKIPDESIDFAMSSPPYLWLRDYGFENQWGLEDTIDEYLDKMIFLTAEIKRVLKKTGSIVFNFGDTYGGGKVHSDWNTKTKGHWGYSEKRRKEMQFENKSIKKPHPNSLLFIPFQFGWRCVKELNLTCHNIIPWLKPNSMPFSGENRFTNKWEPCLWFTKKPSGYYFKLDEVRLMPKALERKPPKMVDRTGQQKLMEGEDPKKPKKQDNVITASGKPDPTKKDFNKRYLEAQKRKYHAQTLNKIHSGDFDIITGEYLGNEKGKNPGDYLILPTKPYPQAHYATYPVELPMYYIQCMCPEGGLVLDPFAGSGTTAEASERLARKWILIEGQRKNLKLIQKRLESWKSDKLTEYEKTESD